MALMGYRGMTARLRARAVESTFGWPPFRTAEEAAGLFSRTGSWISSSTQPLNSKAHGLATTSCWQVCWPHF